MQWLNYHHLLYFRVIANEGGIARAAEKLRLGQPTLSSQLKQLEDMIGKPLFERRNRKMVLTEAGRAALDYANEIFRLGDEMIEVLQDRTSQNQTHLQVGALDGVPKSVILSLVLEAYKVGPCTVSILEGKGDELFRELAAHRIDLVLSNYPPPAEQKQMFAKSVAKLPVAVYGSKQFQSLEKSFPKSLDGKAFVLPTMHSRLRHDLEHYFKLQNIQVLPAAETQDTSLQRLLAANGIGLTALSEVAIEDVRDKDLKRIGRLSGVHEEVWLMSAQRKLENPIAAKLMKVFSLR
ncbi:LysR family transcriptional regulator [Bdellovibrio sp. HCB337]|uniref:LysR family transcriptional regulator n=1 Tax=Bdellovibrio sp. HCB337 TaxID=3394358 RepID=UPI0039A7259B